LDANAHPPQHARRGSLIFSLIAALLAVAALPFALAAYQIHQARESLVEQAQRAHLIAARASADRVGAMLSALRGVAASAAHNPQLHEQPNSPAAGEVLAGLLVGQASVLAAAIFYRDEAGRDLLVQMARQSDAGDLDEATLRRLDDHVELMAHAGGHLIGLAVATPRPGLRVALLANAQSLDDMLAPRELGPSAHLALLQGARAHPALAAPASALPASLLDSIAQPRIASLAVREDGRDGITVSAFSRIDGSDWSVASVQPAADAETAAADMRRSALAAMLAVALLVTALAALAWTRVVQPVRALLAWQRNMISGGGGEGGDLANLKSAFRQIQRHQRNREALSEVFLGRYKLLSTLGQGAMGSVFLAWDPRLKRHVAIKTIHLEALDADRQRSLARTLENEAVAVANLRHRNIVGVHDLVAAGAFAFVVMEYMEGGNLRHVLSRHGALSSGEVVVIARALLRALDAAHRAGLLHLDIKPGNVLVPPEGELKLADFGIATWRSELPDLAARGAPAGTPGYIAPEYVLGEAPSERSDLFSLGVLLMECLSGERPSPASAQIAELRRLASRPLLLPTRVRQRETALAAVLERLCALDPSQRPASAREAMALFDPFDDGDGAERLAERARELGGDAMLSAKQHTASLAQPSRQAAGDDAATRPAPVIVPTAVAALAGDTTDAGPLAEQATRPPPTPVGRELGPGGTLTQWNPPAASAAEASTDSLPGSDETPTLRSSEEPTTQPLP